MKVALAQINPTVGNIEYNVNKIIDFAHRAYKAGAELVVFPELAICGYPPGDLLLKTGFVDANLEGLAKLSREIKQINVLVGFVDKNPGPGRPLFNACALIAEGAVQAVQHKTLLPTYDVFDEDRYFERAESYASFAVNGKHLGVSICEDIWHDAESRPRYTFDPLKNVAKQKPNLLVNLSASPYSIDKELVRQKLVSRLAASYGLPFIYVNQVGGNDELIFDGRSIVVDKNGKVIAEAKAFAEDLLIVDLEVAGSKTFAEKQMGVIENVHSALVLGTKDYMRKCNFQKALVGLSGGIDSAVVAAIAAEAIGADSVLGVSMPSPYSSEHSKVDAQDLAKNLGIEFKTIAIEKPMQSMYEILAPAFAGQKQDVTEENIQARLRGITLMALSNKFGYLLLTTGNKSESAVGYCTLYGDMCGGLAVISDVPKMRVYDLAEYINKKAGRIIIPKSTIEKEPSAELRPGQKDQDTLPPYKILDAIIYAYVEKRQSPEEIVQMGFAPEIVTDVINRIDRNEYKRYQAAPGLKVTGQSFGLGWRMPIAQGYKEQIKSVKHS